MPLSWGPWSPYAAHMEVFLLASGLGPGLAEGKEGAGGVWQPAGPARIPGAGHTVALPVTPGAPSPAIEDVPRVTQGWREPD